MCWLLILELEALVKNVSSVAQMTLVKLVNKPGPADDRHNSGRLARVKADV